MHGIIFSFFFFLFKGAFQVKGLIPVLVFVSTFYNFYKKKLEIKNEK